jgi:hypothetical protein
MDEGEKKARRWQPSPFLRATPKQDRALPGEGEPESSATALGGDVGGLGTLLRERTGRRGGVWPFNGRVVSVAGRDGRGALRVHWPGWAVASQCSIQACAASGFLEGRECTEVQRWTRRSSSHVGTQVFDRGAAL